jgi:hypothetical protein
VTLSGLRIAGAGPSLPGEGEGEGDAGSDPDTLWTFWTG